MRGEGSGPGHRVGQGQGQNLSPELSSSQENPGWKVGGSATGGESSCSRWGACAAGPRLAPRPPFSSCSQLLAEDLPPGSRASLPSPVGWPVETTGPSLFSPSSHCPDSVAQKHAPRSAPAHHCLSCGLALPGLPLCTPSPVAHPLLGASQPSLTLLPSKSSNTSRVHLPIVGGPHGLIPSSPSSSFVKTIPSSQWPRARPSCAEEPVAPCVSTPPLLGRSPSSRLPSASHHPCPQSAVNK